MSDFKPIVKCNGHRRPLVSAADLDPKVYLSEFGSYLDHDALIETGEWYSPRFFCYRGSWYDSQEFESAPDWAKVGGFDAWQTESVWSAVGVQWFDRDGYEFDGEVVVGYMHW